MEISAKKKSILKLLLKIPKGKVVTYKEIAKAVGTSPRAVGQVLKRNPCPQAYPCYRVINSNGKIGGYFGENYARKSALLRKDGIVIRKNSIALSKFGYKFKK